MKTLKQLRNGLMVSLALAVGVFGGATLVGDSVSAEVCSGSAVSCAQSGANASGQSGGMSLQNLVKRIVNILLYVIGAVAVIMIIIGALRYVTSSGDSSQTTAAKNTILYAVVGLVIAVLAYAIVNFVLGAFAQK